MVVLSLKPDILGVGVTLQDASGFVSLPTHLGEAIHWHSLKHQQYADDTRLYISALGLANDAGSFLLRDGNSFHLILARLSGWRFRSSPELDIFHLLLWMGQSSFTV